MPITDATANKGGQSLNSSPVYNDFSNYLQLRYPEYKVQKISLNAGCTCPNRDGSKGVGGCTYCNNSSFTPEYALRTRDISAQLSEGISFFSGKYPDMRYLAYFQSYTNTYGDRERLLEAYRTAIDHPGVVGLVIGTRPDCIDTELLDELQRLSEHTALLYLEYGVESTLHQTLQAINRGHSFEDSQSAIIATAERNIPVGAHLIIGLPGEDVDDYRHHIDQLNLLPITSLKLHQLQILRGTQMAIQYHQDPTAFSLPSADEYVATVSDLIARMRPDLYIDRLVSQSPQQLRIAPNWQIKNHEIVHKVNRYMHSHGLVQGSRYASPKEIRNEKSYD